jgi:hypothetical protein
LLYHDGEDIAFATSIETTHPKYGPFTLHHPNGHNAIVHLHNKGIACKHVVKVFKMPHPNNPNGAIVGNTGTFHGVNNGPSTTSRHTVCDDLHDEKANIKKKDENIGSLEMITAIAQPRSVMLNQGTSLTKHLMT